MLVGVVCLGGVVNDVDVDGVGVGDGDGLIFSFRDGILSFIKD